MTEKEGIRLMLKRKRLSEMDLAIKLGYRNGASISRYLSSDSPHLRVDKLVAMLDAAGYEMVFRDKDSKDANIVVNMQPLPEQRKYKDSSIILTDTGTGFVDSRTGMEIRKEDFDKVYSEIVTEQKSTGQKEK